MESNRKIIINVGRQIGSGGRIIARMLADDFKCGFYDRELLTLAAKESGFCEKFFEQNDEQKGFFHSLFHLHSPFVGDGSFYDNEFSQEGLFKFQSDTIRRLAEAGSCVFVGRCADYVLRDFKNVVNVFITANMDDRISEIRKRKECTEAEALKLIESGDKGRSTYYNYYTGKKWGDSSSYDLCVNTSLLGLEATEAYIKEFIQKVLNIDL
ncbi:cytidylate kinase-like family protein [Prevotella sp.]|uniref:cytidylate kinase-like family protein n=1 Tax=Prevotella sp. TaxID=59823 RepID=UPI00307E35D3